MAKFCVMFYFLSWFEINHNVSDGSNQLFNMMQKVQKFSHDQVQKIAIEILQKFVF